MSLLFAGAAFAFLICHSAAALAKGESRYAAIVVDHYSGKILYARNVDEPRYPASLTKIMTLYLLFKEIKAGKLSYEDTFLVTANASMQAPSKLGLKVGTTIKVKDVIRALVTKSANDAAVVVAENLAGTEERFARVMTATAQKIGMMNTQFRNASGLPNGEQKTTARDMVILGRRMIHDFPEQYKFFKLRYFKYKGKRYRNHNGLLFNYDGTDGIKTGYTRASGFNLTASVKRNKKHLVAVVMGGKSAGKRNAHMRAILNRSWSKASKFKPQPKPAQQIVLRRPAPSLARPGRIAEPASYQTAASEPHKDLRPTITSSGEGAAAHGAGPYHVQIGAYESQSEANAQLSMVHAQAQDILSGHSPITMAVPIGNRNLVRARFAAFTKDQARSACAKLRQRSIECLVIKAK